MENIKYKLTQKEKGYPPCPNCKQSNWEKWTGRRDFIKYKGCNSSYYYEFEYSEEN